MTLEQVMERGSILKKGNTRHFGYKAHIGADRETGLTHHCPKERTPVVKWNTFSQTDLYLADRRSLLV